ncbi:hypothetical protein EGR_04895 [Echinococcus granulosus]|uniref:Uncharacterized protein n=1 Tax=Echinococcus granulosus TaxID=6210 RepID=W6UFI3_ECHGR|nr:hypothetical protein EGR_04895 [Echinococcus granulosus]EUB60185.1 hypothetical protein EGR_04895 [Echinococcus granulosus]
MHVLVVYALASHYQPDHSRSLQHAGCIGSHVAHTLRLITPLPTTHMPTATAAAGAAADNGQPAATEDVDK